MRELRQAPKQTEKATPCETARARARGKASDEMTPDDLATPDTLDDVERDDTGEMVDDMSAYAELAEPEPELEFDIDSLVWVKGRVADFVEGAPDRRDVKLQPGGVVVMPVSSLRKREPEWWPAQYGDLAIVSGRLYRRGTSVDSTWTSWGEAGELDDAAVAAGATTFIRDDVVMAVS